MIIFKTDFQPTMKCWSWALKLGLVVIGIILILKTFAVQSLIEQIASFLLGSTLIGIYIYILSVIPSFIAIDEKGIIIKRTFDKKYIPYSIIKDVFIYNEVQSDIRYFGSNGFLGYIGIMGSTIYGKYHSYVKNPKQQVFIVTQKKNYLLSCENRKQFIEEILKKISAIK